MVRPDSSKMRVRLDDSSQISKDKLPTSALSDIQNQRRHLSPVQANKINPPEIVFDDDDSISELNPKVRSMELNRLREENSELKDKLMQLKNKMESADGGAAPLGMTTFSPARES